MCTTELLSLDNVELNPPLYILTMKGMDAAMNAVQTSQLSSKGRNTIKAELPTIVFNLEANILANYAF
jgi:hypothetical protein